MIKKLIIWGYPLYSDTFSYVWQGFYKAALANENIGAVYWFTDEAHPPASEFDYSNCVFLSEGWKDSKLPINSSSTYIVHCPRDKERYKQGKRFIDLRYYCDYQDHPTNYNYVLDRYTAETIGPAAAYERDNDGEKLYLAWATDLLPREINFTDAGIKRSNKVYFIGTLYSDKYENKSAIDPFREECQKAGLEFIHIDPWIRPVTMEENRRLISESFMAPDLRGPHNVKTGYIPCRIFKNISYGQLGITNSRPVYSLLNEMPIYHPDPAALFSLARSQLQNTERIIAMMNLVKKHHTYVNRLQAILDIL